MSDRWFWLSLFLLGAYHGINPAMGWLFAVALGLQEKSGRAVYRSFLPLAIGHLISVCAVVALVRLFLIGLSPQILRMAGAAALIGFGLYRLIRSRHPRWVGMQVSARDLSVWSFLMASAHGAGLMLVPFILTAPHSLDSTMAMHHMAHPVTMMSAVPLSLGVSPMQAWFVVGLHTLGYLLATLALALVVYYKLGVAVLHRGWLNLDFLWTIALIATGVLTLVA
jgi:hypothetical protein